MSDLQPKKLKVAELRTELQSRGLDTKGTKAVLVRRLEKFLAGACKYPGVMSNDAHKQLFE